VTTVAVVGSVALTVLVMLSVVFMDVGRGLIDRRRLIQSGFKAAPATGTIS
jgi:hypothetical protein